MHINEILGHSRDARLVLINCDDVGMSDGANAASLAAVRAGQATSATVMIPADSARDAIVEGRGLALGVHLTLNSEWPNARWQPLTEAPSLRDPDGALCRRISDTVRHATADDVHSELAAQVAQAVDWGMDISHLDAHMYVLDHRADLFEIYLDLARHHRLPVRLTGTSDDPDNAWRSRAHELGVPAPDHLVPLSQVGSRADLTQAACTLRPGLTEFHVHPVVATPATQRIASDWRQRVDDAELLADPDFHALLADAGAVLVSYRDLRDAARTVRPGAW